jgi:hypothetical protein
MLVIHNWKALWCYSTNRLPHLKNQPNSFSHCSLRPWSHNLHLDWSVAQRKNSQSNQDVSIRLDKILPYTPQLHLPSASFLHKLPSLQISLPPHSPPFLITSAPHSLHHYRSHFLAVPSKPDRQLLPMHPMHNQSKPSSKGVHIRRPSSMKTAGLALINCTEILTQCSVTRENLRGHPLFGYTLTFL